MLKPELNNQTQQITKSQVRLWLDDPVTKAYLQPLQERWDELTNALTSDLVFRDIEELKKCAAERLGLALALNIEIDDVIDDEVIGYED